jgi:hypothetical protein
MALIDRDTALTATAGGVMGARGFSAWTALAITSGLTALTLCVSRARPDLIPPRAEQSGARFAVDVAVAMAAWWGGTLVFPRQPPELAARTIR